MVEHAGPGDAFEVVSVPITSSLASELRTRAGAAGLDVTELVQDLFIGALRSEPARSYPTFTVADDLVADFVADGFRVVARQNGQSTLCPFDGLPFDEAMAELRTGDLSDDEILRVTRS